MTFTRAQFQVVIKDKNDSSRVAALQQLLGYPVKEKDPGGSRFWYLRPGVDAEQATDTCPIAVGFYEELVSLSELEAKRFFTEEAQQRDIYGHYISRVAEEQPVMYLLLPHGSSGTVSLILPGEGKLRQQQIQTFSCDDEQLLSRLKRITQDEIFIATKALMSVPLVEWVFYEPIKTAKELALKLAQAARQIEQVIPIAYKQEREDGYLHTLLKSFQRELLPSLKLSADNEKDYSFADIYAQTIAYALFTARVFGYVRDKRAGRTQETLFDRQSAWQQLPETNPFLRKLFQDVSERSAEKLGDDLIGAIADIFVILRTTKMDAILSDFEMKMNREDIVIRFYEDFLAAYKPQMRERRGVYYTPEPVVSYMVRSVDILVREKFNKPLGLADPTVTILDPACGTGTFLLYIFQLIYQRFQEFPATLTEGLADRSWSGYVEERLLPRIFGFELLMSPYAIAHLKIGLFLQETGYRFDGAKRLGVYLINTLEDITLREETQQLSLNIPQMEELIAEEAKAGTRVKKEELIMVVIGNPPYSYDSSNNGEWISSLVRDYYKVDGKELGERNPKGLQDDYVKFIRFAQWRIDKSGQGVLAFISNHGFLDNPTFRGMRQHLMNSFNGIYIYDLHGNSKKKETDMDGGKDENVFDIQQGVSIAVGIKGENKYIKHSHLFGTREYKYKTLTENIVNSTNFKTINPQSEFYLLIPQETESLDEFNSCYKITEVFPINNMGITTGKDQYFVDFDEMVISKRFNQQEKIAQVCYRPFDKRYIFYDPEQLERARFDFMSNLYQANNLALITIRRPRNNQFDNFWVSNDITDKCIISSLDNAQIFPLFNYLKTSTLTNFSQDFLKKIEINLGYLPTPETIFYYIYAIFHSPTYRTRYAEFLKIDFPRVPITSDKNLFSQLAKYGEELVALHLMKSPRLNNLITQFTENGGHGIVDPAHPKYTQSTVVINKKGDKFVGVPEAVWNFYIGGYQVCQKWLKDRKGRTLNDNDIQHYQRIIVALQETIKLMQSIDETIPNWPIQ
ncbi:N-6 DNA methylase [Cylindrospermopsis raciborskii CHAB3438]|uniref:type ISP restriction/modification enzyme n=1 Tax=Cylindrospermopsis raciborskii TaxID=77022 RepID=UPI001F0E7E29|nr:type ISP restriction/modification enzyme [Cylindrospermopsis raciborskii]MCH4903377.1 N-6 DNA methylase [Cylindrospermopsis raciborskii CHAB3438]